MGRGLSGRQIALLVLGVISLLIGVFGLVYGMNCGGIFVIGAVVLIGAALFAKQFRKTAV